MIYLKFQIKVNHCFCIYDIIHRHVRLTIRKSCISCFKQKFSTRILSISNLLSFPRSLIVPAPLFFLLPTLQICSQALFLLLWILKVLSFFLSSSIISFLYFFLNIFLLSFSFSHTHCNLLFISTNPLSSLVIT